MKLHIVSLTLVAVIASACGAASSAPAGKTTAPSVIPLAAVQQEVAGKPVVYLFTAQGCSSCVEQAKALAAAAHGRPSVQLVGVDLTNDNVTDFAAYITAIGLADSPFTWTVDRDGSLARRYGILSLGSTVFIASDGRVRFVNSGPQGAQTLSAQLGQLS